jgi:hypothetical protein
MGAAVALGVRAADLRVRGGPRGASLTVLAQQHLVRSHRRLPTSDAAILPTSIQFFLVPRCGFRNWNAMLQSPQAITIDATENGRWLVVGAWTGPVWSCMASLRTPSMTWP